MITTGNFPKALEGGRVIKRTKGGYVVVSETSGRRLGGPYKTKQEAVKRLRQVEYFKSKGKGRKKG